MRKQIIYDLPTRIFHWLFSALFVVAFFIAETVDDDNPTFSVHMLTGLMLGGLVLLRILWGLVGSRYARFSSFALRPVELTEYIKGILTGSKKRWTGHNPASSWAALAMLGLALMLAITGILMTSGYKETFEDAHELFANAFLVTVLLHIAGVLLHTFRHQDSIALSMVHGNKEVSENTPVEVTQRPIVALTLIVFMAMFAGYIFKNYNTTTSELNLFGKTLVLGEDEKKDD